MDNAHLVSEEDPLWSKPCLAYNLHAGLDPDCQADFTRAQDRLSGYAPGTLRCPPRTFHLSVASLLSVRHDYGTPKDAVWAKWGKQWASALQEVASGLRPFPVYFSHLQVGNSAVIALARPVPQIEEVRRRAEALLSGAGLLPAQPSIVHCTLLRYGASGVDLSDLERRARRVELAAKTVVKSLVISKELVYPNLKYEIVDAFPLAETAA
jgi:2'-5' RNA ligase